MSTVLRLFLLPHKDNRQMFFILSLDPPIKQGQTRYHYLVLLFGNEEDTSIELPFSEDELKAKYEDKLTKELSGPVYEVLGKIMKVLVNRKLTGPGSFLGHSGTPAIGCSYKATAGYLYPLERGFIYVHKPPMHIRFEEIATVNFARSGGSTRSFDFEIELKSSAVHTFSSIEKEEYTTLFNFITQKKIHVKNTGKNVSFTPFYLLNIHTTSQSNYFQLIFLIFFFFKRINLVTFMRTLVIRIMMLSRMHIWHVSRLKVKNVIQIQKVSQMMNRPMMILIQIQKKLKMLLKNMKGNIICSVDIAKALYNTYFMIKLNRTIIFFKLKVMLKRRTRKMIRTTVQHVKKRKRKKKRRKNEKRRKLARQVYAIFLV